MAASGDDRAPRPGKGIGALRRDGYGRINKASQIILAREQGDLDLVDRKTFTFLLGRVCGELGTETDTVHRVPVADILQYLGHSSTDRLNESLARLSSVEIVIDYLDENGVANSAKAHYLSYNLAHAADGWVHFAFDALLLRFLHNPKVFATLSLSHLRRFRSIYSAKLYEIMALHVNRRYPAWEPTIEEFREMMAVGDGYARFDNLRKRVIETAVDEVNAIAPFSVDAEDIRGGKGGKIVGLRFTAVPKGPATLAAAAAAAAAPGRRGSRSRDPHTIDMLTNRTDAERDPLELSPDTLRAAIDEIGDSSSGIEPLVEEWRGRFRGRRVRDPDRSFLNWLEMKLARERSEALKGLVDDDTIASLLEQWEAGR